MNNKQILDNAPEGATHVLFQSLDNIYIKFDVHTQGRLYCKHKEGWRLATHVFYARLRSLSEISEIESLREQLKTAKADGLIHFTKSEIKLPKHTKSQLFSNGYSTGVNDVIEAAVNYANKIKEQGE